MHVTGAFAQEQPLPGNILIYSFTSLTALTQSLAHSHKTFAGTHFHVDLFVAFGPCTSCGTETTLEGSWNLQAGILKGE